MIRTFNPADLEPVVGLLKKTLIADPMTSEIFQRKVLLDPNFDTQSALVAEEDGNVVGLVLGLTRRLLIEDQSPDFDRAWITLIAVEPKRQRKGIGQELLSRLQPYLKEKGASSIWVSPYAPNYFSPGIDINAYPGAVQFFRKLGFDEVYRPLSMDASLLSLQTPEWVQEKERSLAEQGVVIELYNPHHILPVLEFMKAEFPGDWQRYIRETMSKITLGQYSPDQIWVALESGKVLGFAQHEGERFGPFGVASNQRGQGIGAVLLFKCLHAMRDKGLHNAWFLWTDDKTAKLYKEAGFAETRRYVVMRKTLE
ncbi:MAG TPA: GNAT family N-acetyltransferase [Armatimonadota bacterium]|nr:GNAT family N-acetyltransferase [Armatimonadota bacterium]